MKFNQLLLFIFLFGATPFLQSMNVTNENDVTPIGEQFEDEILDLGNVNDFKHIDLNNSHVSLQGQTVLPSFRELIKSLNHCECACEGCEDFFKNAKELHEHCVKEHMPPKERNMDKTVFCCTWTDCENLMRKQNKKPRTKPYKTRTRRDLVNHFAIHAKYMRYKCTKCTKCGSTSYREDSIRKHCKKRHNDEKAYEGIKYN